MNPNEQDVPQLDDVEQLLLAGRELECAAARLALANLLAGVSASAQSVWTFSSPSGRVVLRGDRFEIEPAADGPADTSCVD